MRNLSLLVLLSLMVRLSISSDAEDVKTFQKTPARETSQLSSYGTNQYENVENNDAKYWEVYNLKYDRSHLINIEVCSSVRRVYLRINKEEIFDFTTTGPDLMESNVTEDGNKTNGLHLIVLHPEAGHVILRRIYRTYMFAEGMGLPELFSSYVGGEIFILAAKYDGGLNLNAPIRKVWKLFGARKVYNIQYRCYFIWVFSRSGKTYLETFINDYASSMGDFNTSPVYGSVSVPKAFGESCWGPSPEEEKRKRFCRQYGGYGSLCDCEVRHMVPFNTLELENTYIKDVPVVILASRRPQILYKSLLTLLTQPGSFRNRTLVSMDGSNEEMSELLKVLEVPYEINDMSKRSFPGTSARISAHYRWSMNTTLNRFPTSNFLIVLEEDILVAPDFMSFMNQTAHLLEVDPSIYCISAYNDLAALHSYASPNLLVRMETLPSYGWMVTRKFFDEIKDRWVTVEKNFDWDIWFRGPWVRASRECVLPEVSRSFHQGESGVHIKGQLTFSHFIGHLTTSKKNIKLHNVHRMPQQIYEEDLYDLFESDRVTFLNTTLHPCHTKYIPKNYTEKAIVVFVSMLNAEDLDGWRRFSTCLGVWNLDNRNHHRGMIQMNFYGTKIYVIGYPFSDYSFLKPSGIYPLSGEVTSWDKENMALFSLMIRARFRVPEKEKWLPYLSFQRPKNYPRIYKMIYVNDTESIKKVTK